MNAVATKNTPQFWLRLVFTIALSSQLPVHLAGCAHGVEDVSQPTNSVEPPPPTVVAPLSDDLKSVLLKNIKLRATLFLDDSTQYNMSISNGVATWQKKDLAISNPYALKVRFDIELPSNPGVSLPLAQALVTHNFSTEATQTFAASDLETALFDNDNDTMTNLAEILAGGNPFNPAPTFLSPKQITVFENSTAVLNVQAISPHTNAVLVYSLLTNTDGLFAIDGNTGALSYIKPASYDSINLAANNHMLTIQVADGFFTETQDITITVTNVFELRVNVGLKQIQFHWSGDPEADYYKIARGSTNAQNGVFTQLPNSGSIAELTYDFPLAIHLFDLNNPFFVLQSYKVNTVDNSGDILVRQSPAIDLTANLVDASGYFKAFQSDAGDNFGRAVALSADGNTMAVGALWEDSATSADQADNSALDSGAVTVFKRASGNWQPLAYIKAPNILEGAWFGYALALSADGSTLVVGAPHKSISDSNGVIANNAGAAFVYVNGDWSNPVTVLPATFEVTSNFGYSLSLNAAGTQLAVGAPAKDIKDSNGTVIAADAGAVYVFTAVNGSWQQPTESIVTAANAEATDEFGTAVALSADGSVLAVSAPAEDSAASGVNDIIMGQGDNSVLNAGAVYTFTNATGSWQPQAYIKASTTEAGDYFGATLALSADANTLVVGAFREASTASGINDNSVGQGDNNASYAGAVYVFNRASNDLPLTQQAYVKASNTDSGDGFGRAIALSADGKTLAVGAPWEDSASGAVQADNNATDAGAVYVFSLTNSGWQHQSYVKAATIDAGDWFGTSVALSANGTDLAVGTNYEDSAATGINDTTVGQADNSAYHAGAVYLY